MLIIRTEQHSQQLFLRAPRAKSRPMGDAHSPNHSRHIWLRGFYHRRLFRNYVFRCHSADTTECHRVLDGNPYHRRDGRAFSLPWMEII